MTMRRLRAGVVGAGVIAQVMHLHYLRELAGHFEIAALCDIAPENASANAATYGVPLVFTDWREMLRGDIDVVLILTSGSHARIAVEAARAGKHVLVEKPMSLSVAEGELMRAEAVEHGVTLMVGYPKRYDPAFARFREEIALIAEPRLLRVTTFEAPFRPYLAHYPLAPVVDLPAGAAAAWRTEVDESVTAALGDLAEDGFLRRQYHEVLLDCMVHELNTVRSLFGEPGRLDYADLGPASVTVMLRYGDMRVALHWMDLPGMTRYQMEFACYGPDRRATLRFPSPYLRSAPAKLKVEGGDTGTTRSWRTEETTSYDSAFRRELLAFHECVTTGATPLTDATDALHDLALCRSIVQAFATGVPVDRPSALTLLEEKN
ncbi:Gfo/Idh/MocA family oxidoreductase [Streptosporangiaceae bacterium NEAU-GS5]|nr:Gfo/Idh/MocA family oxidoreductase [Streptosporangiaceae bacterium NEAU-GS5]